MTITRSDRYAALCIAFGILVMLATIALLQQRKIDQNEEILQQNERIVDVLRTANEQIKRITNPTIQP